MAICSWKRYFNDILWAQAYNNNTRSLAAIRYKMTRSQHAHRFFHLGVHVPFYLHFWGYIQIFGGAISNSSFGGTKKINCIFSTQGRAPCCFFVNLRRVGENFYFLSDIGSDRKWGSVWPMAFVCPTIFFVILYITCQILFFIQNWMQDYLYIVMIIKQLHEMFFCIHIFI
jgi:hypothetical protein